MPGLLAIKSLYSPTLLLKIYLPPFPHVVILLLTATSVAAETEIHRCLLPDGTVAFQEMPCAEPATDANDDGEPGEGHGVAEVPATNDDVFDFVNPFDEPAVVSSTAEPKSLEPISQNRAECEKTTRDAIDAIDLEMREKTYTKEQGQEYLEQLLALTRQLRGCRAL